MPSERLDRQKRMASATRRVRELETLYRISHILAAGRRQKQALAEVLDMLDSELGMNRGTVTLLAPDGSEIRIEVAHNLSQERSRNVRYRLGEGVTGKVMQTGKPMIVPKVSQEPLFLNRFDRWNVTKEEISFICVPISIGQEVIGAISVDRIYDEAASLDEDVRVLSIVASMVANDVMGRREAAIRRQELEDENLRLRHELEDRFRPENIIGNSSAMRDVYRQIHQVAASDTTVLIRGESGTGKELVAHAIHYLSPRANKPFVRVNCAALNENLLESELFGHEKGSFTGAVNQRIGKFEMANHGTILLDEISEMSLQLQAKLLRVLQEFELDRVGGKAPIPIDVRVLATTNENLRKVVEKGKFREDLFYRLNVIPVTIIPLRERKEDIPLLVEHFLKRNGAKGGSAREISISQEAQALLLKYDWKGNVRELENFIERAALVSGGDVIEPRHFFLDGAVKPQLESREVPVGSTLKEMEKQLILKTLDEVSGNRTHAAKVLGVSIRTLRNKLNEYRGEEAKNKEKFA